MKRDWSRERKWNPKPDQVKKKRVAEGHALDDKQGN